MPVKDAAKKIHRIMMECKDVIAGDHRFGGTEYKLGKREIGHVHGDILVDNRPSFVVSVIPHQLSRETSEYLAKILNEDASMIREKIRGSYI